MVLVSVGFDADYVERGMGIAELEYRFFRAMKLLAQTQKASSSVLMGSIGSFFVKKGERTIIEHLNDQLCEIDSLFQMESEEMGEFKKTESLINKLTSSFASLGGIKKM